MPEAFEQLQRYMNQRKATKQQGLKEGEPKLFHTAMMVIRSCGLEAGYGTITSGVEHFFHGKHNGQMMMLLLMDKTNSNN